MGEITADLPGVIFIVVVNAGAAALWLAWLGFKERSFPRFRSPRWFYPYFFLGALSGVAAGVIELSPLSQPYDSLGGIAGTLGYYILFIALVEEGVKFTAFRLVSRWRHSLREPFDAVMGGATVGLGFAIMENVVYGLFRDPKLALLRSFITIQAHMFYSSIPALCFGMTMLHRDLQDHRGRSGLTVFGFAVAILIHGLENSFIAFGMATSLIFMIDLVILALLAMLVNRAGEASPYRTFPWHEWRRALPAIKRGLDADPENPNLLFRRGLYCLAAGQWVDACVAFDGVVETGRRRDLAKSYYAASLFACGEKEESEDLFGEHWPGLSPRERRQFARSLMGAMPSRAILRAEIRDITRKCEWSPHKRH